jgi:hypothetical protein
MAAVPKLVSLNSSHQDTPIRGVPEYTNGKRGLAFIPGIDGSAPSNPAGTRLRRQVPVLFGRALNMNNGSAMKDGLRSNIRATSRRAPRFPVSAERLRR